MFSQSIFFSKNQVILSQIFFYLSPAFREVSIFVQSFENGDNSVLQNRNFQKLNIPKILFSQSVFSKNQVILSQKNIFSCLLHLDRLAFLSSRLKTVITQFYKTIISKNWIFQKLCFCTPYFLKPYSSKTVGQGHKNIK